MSGNATGRPASHGPPDRAAAAIRGVQPSSIDAERPDRVVADEISATGTSVADASASASKFRPYA